MGQAGRAASTCQTATSWKSSESILRVASVWDIQSSPGDGLPVRRQPWLPRVRQRAIPELASVLLFCCFAHRGSRLVQRAGALRPCLCHVQRDSASSIQSSQQSVGRSHGQVSRFTGRVQRKTCVPLTQVVRKFAVGSGRSQFEVASVGLDESSPSPLCSAAPGGWPSTKSRGASCLPGWSSILWLPSLRPSPLWSWARWSSSRTLTAASSWLRELFADLRLHVGLGLPCTRRLGRRPSVVVGDHRGYRVPPRPPLERCLPYVRVSAAAGIGSKNLARLM